MTGRRSRNRKRPLDFGFVGEAQVGKSTAINALVGAATVPAGGRAADRAGPPDARVHHDSIASSKSAMAVACSAYLRITTRPMSRTPLRT